MELALLAEHEGEKNWWTSGTDKSREGRWYWASSLAPVKHFLCGEGQPDGGVLSNCLSLGFGDDYTSWDNFCITDYYLICEKNSYKTRSNLNKLTVFLCIRRDPVTLGIWSVAVHGHLDNCAESLHIN